MAQRRVPTKTNSGIESNSVTLAPTTTSGRDRTNDDDDDNVNVLFDSAEDKDLDPLIQKARTVRSLQLEPGDNADHGDDPDLDDERRSQIDRHKARIRHWKESEFACGLVEPSWELQRTFHKHMVGASETAPDEAGCGCCSARICPMFGAGRVGHMVVLKSSQQWVEHVQIDPETGERKVLRYTRPRLDCVVGPYWPMLVLITYPLIFGVSGWVFVSKVCKGLLNPALALAWVVLTIGLIMALALTGCRDPGILYRHDEPPPDLENTWRWNDQALSYRPRNAVYDPDTAVIVQDFDHTCPWTGTAIGGKNMLAFQFFVALVFLMLMLDIFLLTGVLDSNW
ncbi:hypothetical protein MPSEU_000879100 [Mayamaea pseudoterrestris]|nr:hypothetical protein MPSEU_000879100 [Mayamaea pseudoterrestris]